MSSQGDLVSADPPPDSDAAKDERFTQFLCVNPEFVSLAQTHEAVVESRLNGCGMCMALTIMWGQNKKGARCAVSSVYVYPADASHPDVPENALFWFHQDRPSPFDSEQTMTVTHFHMMGRRAVDWSLPLPGIAGQEEEKEQQEQNSNPNPLVIRFVRAL